MEKVFNDAVRFLESLPDDRQPSITVQFARTDDRRRAMMEKIGALVVHYSCDLSIRQLPSDPTYKPLSYDGKGQWTLFKGYHKATPAEAIAECMQQLKTFLAARAKPAAAKHDSEPPAIDPFS